MPILLINAGSSGLKVMLKAIGIVNSWVAPITIFPFFEIEICRYSHIVSAITLLLCSKCCKNYLRTETIQGRKLFAEIWYPDYNISARNVFLAMTLSKLNI